MPDTEHWELTTPVRDASGSTVGGVYRRRHRSDASGSLLQNAPESKRQKMTSADSAGGSSFKDNKATSAQESGDSRWQLFQRHQVISNSIIMPRSIDIRDHILALDALDIPETDKKWNSIPTHLKEPVFWHPKREIRDLAMCLCYTARSILMDNLKGPEWHPNRKFQAVDDEVSSIVKGFKEVFNDA